MTVRVVLSSSNSIDEAFLRGVNAQSVCPYCGNKEQSKDQKGDKESESASTSVVTSSSQVGVRPWLDTHLERCRRKKVNYEAAELLKTNKLRYALHEECGRCFILEVRDGLCLVENDSRRYVVCAADLTVGCVAQCLELIEIRDLSPEQYSELIEHLMVKTKERTTTKEVTPAYRRGMTVEFLQDPADQTSPISAGTIIRRHGKHCFIVEVSRLNGEQYRVNISKTAIIRAV